MEMKAQTQSQLSHQPTEPEAQLTHYRVHQSKKHTDTHSSI